MRSATPDCEVPRPPRESQNVAALLGSTDYDDFAARLLRLIES